MRWPFSNPRWPELRLTLGHQIQLVHHKLILRPGQTSPIEFSYSQIALM
jgi:hypothetical protein